MVAKGFVWMQQPLADVACVSPQQTGLRTAKGSRKVVFVLTLLKPKTAPMAGCLTSAMFRPATERRTATSSEIFLLLQKQNVVLLLHSQKKNLSCFRNYPKACCGCDAVLERFDESTNRIDSDTAAADLRLGYSRTRIL